MIPLAAAIGFLAAPGDLDGKLVLALRGVCAQRPSHSFVVDGQPLALEARMYGIFAGFSVALSTAWVTGRWRRSELPRGWGSARLALLIGLMGLDGVNASLYDLGAPHAYPPRNDLRLATGLLSGVGLAGFIGPVVSFVFWRDREPLPLFSSWRELAWSLAAAGAIGVVVVSGAFPSAALSAIGALAVVGSFWLVNTYIRVLAWEGLARAGGWADLGWAGLAGFVLTIAELIGLGALRGWMEATLGLSWVI